MKKLILSIAFIVTGFTTSSQSLAPQIRIQESDTVFCFTMEQSRSLAKHLVKSVYTDSLLNETNLELDHYYQLVFVKDSAINVTDLRIKNQEELIRISDCIIADQNIQLHLANIITRRQKWQKWLFAVGMVLTGALAISNAR